MEWQTILGIDIVKGLCPPAARGGCAEKWERTLLVSHLGWLRRGWVEKWAGKTPVKLAPTHMNSMITE